MLKDHVINLKPTRGMLSEVIADDNARCRVTSSRTCSNILLVRSVFWYLN